MGYFIKVLNLFQLGILRISAKKDSKTVIGIPFQIIGDFDIIAEPELYPSSDFTILHEDLSKMVFSSKKATTLTLEIFPRFKTELRKKFLLLKVSNSKMIFHFPILIFVH